MDLEGDLIELRTSKIIRIEPGDRVVMLRRGKHDAVDYYNVTRKIGLDALSEAATYKILVAGAVVLILGDVPALLKCLVVGVPSVAAACLGFAMLILGALISVRWPNLGELLQGNRSRGWTRMNADESTQIKTEIHL